jgi:hypothetical protein
MLSIRAASILNTLAASVKSSKPIDTFGFAQLQGMVIVLARKEQFDA